MIKEEKFIKENYPNLHQEIYNLFEGVSVDLDRVFSCNMCKIYLRSK